MGQRMKQRKWAAKRDRKGGGGIQLEKVLRN